MTVYNSIGHHYNSTRAADPLIAQTLYDLLQPRPNGVYLDIGCGTGNYTVALANMGVHLHGIDPSNVMLDEAKAKSSAVQWHTGTAENIAFDDAFFDGAIATLTLHHWNSMDKGFAELYRVLKPGSRMVIFAALADLTEKFWLQRYFPNMLAAACKKEPRYSAIESAVCWAGFTITATKKYYIQDDLQDKFMFAGKNNPQLYFDARVRSGISAFAQLSLKDEVAQGLAQLEEDINNGTFESIHRHYHSDEGDYMFIVIEKQVEN